MKNENLNVAIYCRTLYDDALAIEKQTQEIKEFCNNKKYEIVKIYEDIGYGADNTNRPAYKQMIKDLKKEKFNIIIILDMSRLSSSIMELEKIIKLLIKYNCNLLSIKEDINLNSPLEVFLRRMPNNSKGFFEEYERRN